MSNEKRVLHCWEDGPETADGCSTTCMREKDHVGPHRWTRDDQIGVTFAPATELAALAAKERGE